MKNNEEWTRILKWMNGNEDAARFCAEIMFIAHLWDDLVDGDHRTEDEINAAFVAALVNIPRNPFYQRWTSELVPLIDSAILSWKAANELQNANEEPGDREISYGLRCSVLHVLTHCARLVGGEEHGKVVAVEVWRAGLSEGLAAYLQEFPDA